MNEVLQEICDRLVALRDACRVNVLDLREQLDAAERELVQVEGALGAVAGKPPRRAPRPAEAASAPAKRAPRPCATKEEVLSAIRVTLADNGPLEATTLKDLVADKLRETGRSLSMFAAIFARCLADPSVAPSVLPESY